MGHGPSCISTGIGRLFELEVIRSITSRGEHCVDGKKKDPLMTSVYKTCVERIFYFCVTEFEGNTNWTDCTDQIDCKR
jgi:hypothetical protein